MAFWSIAGPLISAGLGFMGNNAAAGANRDAMAANMAMSDQGARAQLGRDDRNEAMQLYFDTRARQDAQGQLEIMREGYQDPTTGIRVHYVPGKGWVTEYTGAGKAIQEAQQTEMLQNLMVDQPMARRGRVSAESRRIKEGSLADTILNELGGADPYSNDRITADLAAANRRGIEEGFRGAQQGALMNAARTGTSGSNIIAKLAREKARAYQDAEAGAYTEGLRTAEDLRNSRTGRLLGKYGDLANRANNVDNVALPANAVQAQGLSSAASRSGQRPNYGGADSPVQLPATAYRPPTNLFNAAGMPGAATADSLYGLGSMFQQITDSMAGRKKNSGDY